MNDFLDFRRMAAPYLIKIYFRITIVLHFIIGIAAMLHNPGWVSVLVGLGIMGPLTLVVRVALEAIIVVFQINETLTDIRNRQYWDSSAITTFINNQTRETIK